MKYTFLLHLVPADATNMLGTTGSLSFCVHRFDSPETAIVNFNDTMEFCPMEAKPSHLAEQDDQEIHREMRMSTGSLRIHLTYNIDEGNIDGEVIGVANFITKNSRGVTTLNVHGHVILDMTEQDRADAMASHELSSEAAAGPWEGNTGW